MIGRTISHYHGGGRIRPLPDKILEKLGAGGMDTIYKAQHLKLDRYVAFEFLPPHPIQAEEEKKCFIHETKVASALGHNNICSVYEIDETEDGQIIIVTAS